MTKRLTLEELTEHSMSLAKCLRAATSVYIDHIEDDLDAMQVAWTGVKLFLLDVEGNCGPDVVKVFNEAAMFIPSNIDGTFVVPGSKDKN